MTTDQPVFEAVRYGFTDHPWYAKVTFPNGTTHHGGPLRTEWAAERYAAVLRGSHYRTMVKRGDVGNGDECPLFPEHGRMFVLQGANRPPSNYCSHVIHDGWRDVKRSRAIWPVHGFEDAVDAYRAVAARTNREAGLPDLSELEVN